MSFRGALMRLGLVSDYRDLDINLGFLRIRGRTQTIGETSVRVYLKDNDNNVLLCTGTSVPTIDKSGYAKGCQFIKTDAIDGVKALYENQGTNLLTDFNIIGDISSAEIALAEGNILVGNAAGLAAALSGKSDKQILIGNGTTVISVVVSGDISIANDGIVTIEADAVTYAKMQDVSDTNKLLGRETAGAGVVEEIACTAAGRALLDDADAATQVATLGFAATVAEVNTVCDGILEGNAVWDPANIVDGTFVTTDITVTGAAIGDFVLVSPGVDVTDLIVSATVTAPDTVSVVLQNETGGAVDLGSSTWKAKVFK